MNIFNIFNKTLDLSQTIKDLKGNIAEQKYSTTEVVDGVEKEVLTKEPITLGIAIRETILAEIEDPKKISESEHLLRYDIYEKVNTGVDEFTPREISFIKKLISRRYYPLLAGQLLRLINN